MTAFSPDPVLDAEQCCAVRAGRAAADALVQRHLPMVIKIVSDMNLPPTVDRDDLIQEGMIALTHAAWKWEPGRGTKFSTYAFACVLNAVKHAIGREAKRAASLNAHTTLSHETREFLDTFPTPEPPKLPEGFREDVEKLPPILKRVILLYFGLDGLALGAGEIAEETGLSVPQVKRAIAMALEQVPVGSD